MRLVTSCFLLICVISCAALGAEAETGGVGVALKEDHGRIVITKVVPNTPAASSGELHEGDEITSVAQPDAEPVSVKGKHMVEAQRLIKGPQGTTVRLTIVP